MKYELTKPTNKRSMFDVFFGDRFYDDFFAPSLGETSEMASWRPAVDIVEQEDKYVIKADLPGVDEKDVSIEIKDGVLTLKGERSNEYKEEKDNVYRCERSYGSFMRSFNIADINEEKIDAQYKDGILKIELPKAEQKKPKKVAIKKS